MERIIALLPECELTVFSFREELWEPPFFEDIKSFVETRGHRFFEGKRVGDVRNAAVWDEKRFDLLFAVSWRFLVPASVFQRSVRGAYVLHDSLLPEYRGFSPTVWAIINGEDHTGVTLFEMAEAMDFGPVVAQKRVPIGETETIADVMERVTASYLSLLEDNLPALLAGTAIRKVQNEDHATYCCKRLPSDNKIVWSRSARDLHNLIRAVGRPYPGAYVEVNGKTVIVWSASLPVRQLRYRGAIPGRVIEVLPGKGVIVLTGDGCIMLEKVDVGEGRTMAATDVFNQVGMTL